MTSTFLINYYKVKKRILFYTILYATTIVYNSGVTRSYHINKHINK